METRSSLSLALVLFILNSLALFTSSTPFSNDEDALLAFKNGVASDPRSVLTSNWSTNASFCSWTGVSCSLDHRRVTAINLSGLQLKGTIAPHLGNLTFLQSFDISSNYFTGSIPSELTKLRRLQEINVGNNSLSGEIPSGIFTNMSVLIDIILTSNELSGELPSDICSNTPKLKRIFLRQNQVSGKIPTNIYKCRELEELRLSLNQFNGKIPSEIGNLTMLTTLALTSNGLQGNIPSSIFNISVLGYVDLSKNNLCGSIPTFNNMPKLEELYLHKNKLTGSIPEEIGSLTSLINLFLYENNLTGHVPKQIGNLTALKLLYLQSNNLTGELPGELGNLKNIGEVNAYNNHFSNDLIPPSIFNLSTLKILALSFNHFSGSLPPNMGLSLFNLEKLYLSANRLSGKIPSSITNASKLNKLELDQNSFTGSIPDFGNLRKLQVLRLWENNLRGAESPNQELRFLSSLTNCRALNVLQISNNPLLNGILPTSVGNFSTSLTDFVASGCSIRGTIPSGFGNLSSMLTLDLSKNKLAEFIPKTMGKLKQLGKLLLYDNKLQGSIPNDLCGMSKLVYLYLFGNMLTGPIPSCLGRMKSLRKVSFASNKLNSTLPSDFFNLPDLIFLNLSSNYVKGQLPYQIRSLKGINKLDLSSNKFSGFIPNSIIGCEVLQFLNLSNNMFNGSIPQSLGEVKGLRTLDLSDNHLSGLIPKSLEKLDLVQFNVSCNQLKGEIPDGGCFASFSAQSFLNNSALCGTERFQVASCNPRSASKSVALVMKYAVLSFVAVMFLMVGILILIRRRRPPPTTENSSSVVDSWQIISEREIELGTSSFSEMNLLGKGSIGSVFKATLADGTVVAVKVFNLQVEGATKIFDTESRVLGTIRHRNLIKTLGCCCNAGFKALILAYMPNGSLEEWLHSSKICLDLVERVNIAIDVALALEYLHHGHTFPIVHCDIKPSNVLLDADMTAHVGDFGVSKLFDNGETAVHTINMATIGYAAPEFGSEGKVSTSGDVYSYGILLLEMFTSKKPTDDMFSAEMSIKEWVEKALQENAISEVVAPSMLSRKDDVHFSEELQALQSTFQLAMKCLAFSPEKRIKMVQVVVDLQKIKANFRVEQIQKKHHR